MLKTMNHMLLCVCFRACGSCLLSSFYEYDKNNSMRIFGCMFIFSRRDYIDISAKKRSETLLDFLIYQLLCR